MTKQERIDLLSDFKEMTSPEMVYAQTYGIFKSMAKNLADANAPGAKEFQDVVKMMSKHCKTKETLAKIFRPTK